jgi:S-(hydroxymethyl)glutathione dehydrogenase/alcohol dehydrogenase
MTMRAAVLNQVGDTKLEVRDDVTTVGPGPGEVKIRIAATGVCHSDLSAMDGTIPHPAPAVLGHEGAGEVIEVGSAITDLAPGDHVIVCWNPSCGACKACLNGQANLCMVYLIESFTSPRFRLGEAPVYGMAGTGTFAEEVVVPRNGAVKIAEDVPFDIASLIGCGVMTGVGAVVNAAKVEPGTTVCVIGCGGVGASVIQGAKVAGAAVITAVDLVDSKLESAKRFGATHAVTPDDLPQLVQELTGGDGFDYAFEVIGRSTTMRQAFDVTRRGGTTTIVGVGKPDDMVQFSAGELFFAEKTLRGSYYGSADTRRDYHRLLALWRAGRLDLDSMISRRVKLDEVNEAFDAMQAGEVIRSVIEL